MRFKETMAKIFNASEGLYYKWKKEERPIITLLDKYFNKEDLEEYLNTQEIKKMQYISKDYTSEELKFLKDNPEAVKKYIESVSMVKGLK